MTIDSLRADRLGLYGYERDTSPRLDAFLEVRSRWDPERRLRSAQSVRLLGDRP